VVLATSLDYIPTTLLARGTVVGPAAVQAHLRYMIRVLGPDNAVLLRDSGEVLSTSQWTTGGGSSTTAAEAVAAMYQNVAKQLLKVLK